MIPPNRNNMNDDETMFEETEFQRHTGNNTMHQGVSERSFMSLDSISNVLESTCDECAVYESQVQTSVSRADVTGSAQDLMRIEDPIPAAVGSRRDSESSLLNLLTSRDEWTRSSTRSFSTVEENHQSTVQNAWISVPPARSSTTPQDWAKLSYLIRTSDRSLTNICADHENHAKFDNNGQVSGGGFETEPIQKHSSLPFYRIPFGRLSSKDWEMSERSLKVMDDTIPKSSSFNEEFPESSSLSSFDDGVPYRQDESILVDSPGSIFDKKQPSIRTESQESATVSGGTPVDSVPPSSFDKGNTDDDEEITVVPSETDVLFGRGGMSNYHPRNLRYREEVRKRRNKYQTTMDRREKQQIAKDVVNIFLRDGGRFLRKIPKTNKWIVASPKVRNKKVSQALREKDLLSTFVGKVKRDPQDSEDAIL